MQPAAAGDKKVLQAVAFAIFLQGPQQPAGSGSELLQTAFHGLQLLAGSEQPATGGHGWLQPLIQRNVVCCFAAQRLQLQNQSYAGAAVM